MFAVYALGIMVALFMGKLFSSTLFKGETSDFILELPPLPQAHLGKCAAQYVG